MPGNLRPSSNPGGDGLQRQHHVKGITGKAGRRVEGDSACIVRIHEEVYLCAAAGPRSLQGCLEQGPTEALAPHARMYVHLGVAKLAQAGILKLTRNTNTPEGLHRARDLPNQNPYATIRPMLTRKEQ